MSLWSQFSTCLSARVHGKPAYQAQHVEQGLCRLKWVAAGVIPLWLINWAALNRVGMQDFLGFAQAISQDHAILTARLLVASSFIIGIAAATLLVFAPCLTMRHAKRLVAVSAVGILLCEGLHLAFSFFLPIHFTSFGLVMLGAMFLFPLSVTALSLLAAFAVITPILIVAGVDAQALTPGEWSKTLLMMTNPLSFAAVGIIGNQWHWQDFRAKRLTELRLRRRTRQLEQQKAASERHQAETESLRAQAERQKSQALNALASALTRPVAEAWHRTGAFPPTLKTVCVIACDAVDFSKTCRKLQPERVLEELRKFFTRFDEACLRMQVEPLRAQGDSRIALAGLWMDDHLHVHHAAIGALLAMLDFRRALPDSEESSNDQEKVLWPARIGIALGPAFIGVINTAPHQSITGSGVELSGEGRLWFDAWGDTVNLAARLGQAVAPNGILVRESVLWETRGLFDHGPIGPVQVKETVIPDCAVLLGIRAQYRTADGSPNEAFWHIYHDERFRPLRPPPEGTLIRGEATPAAVLA